MATFDSSEEIPRYLDSIAVIGGGRWARVLTQVLCGIVAPPTRISVHSPHNAESMSVWAAARGLEERIHVSSEWPRLLPAKPNAVIVANAGRDHEKAVEWALSAGVPVLVEKPVALTAAASHRLADLARSRKARFAAAHVFLFARYVDNFSRVVAKAEGIRFVRVRWTDPQCENRHGEQKQFDPGLPVFADCLPHVLSIVGRLTPGLAPRCESLEFLRGGAHVKLGLRLGDIPCRVDLVRNGDRRQRMVEVSTSEELLRLDFSTEPGTIVSGTTTIVGDPNWELKRRPAALMLAAFLRWAAGGEFDERLAIEIGLQANHVIDDASALYNSALVTWLTTRLSCPGESDDDLRYALGEILQSGGSLPANIIEQQSELVRQQCSRTTDPRWLRALVESRDPSLILESIAT